MRFIAILFFFAFTPQLCLCQVTLNASDYPPVLTGIDTLRITTAASLFPAFSTSTPGMWDMTLTTDSSGLISLVRKDAIGYDFGDSLLKTIGLFGYSSLRLGSVAGSALFTVGQISEYTSFSLTTMTMGPTDTFYILDQASTYSSPIREIAFPATNSSSWNSAGFVDIAFELSVATYFYLHEPGYMRTYTEHSDVVTNWGKMRVRDASGAPSPYIDVLQVQTTTITTDSAFLSGGPMPGHIQLLLGITQGKKDTVYSQSYYRVGEVTPLAYVEFTDETFSHAIRAKTHMQRLTTNVAAVSPEPAVMIFPNPASTTVNVTDDSGVFTQYEITDIAGRLVHKGNFPHKKHHQVLLPTGIRNGYYNMRLSTDSGKMLVTGFVVSK